MVSAYIAHDADRGTDRSLRAFVSEFLGLSSSAKQKAVLEDSDMARAKLSELVCDKALDSAAIAKLLAAMKAHSKKVKPKALGVIGRDHMAARCQTLDAEMESFRYAKAYDESNGIPSAVEAAFVWLGDGSAANRRLITGVNWSPGILNPFRSLGKLGKSLDSVLEAQRAGRDEPVVLLLHMVCPRAEYTDRGKSAVVVSDEEPESVVEEEGLETEEGA